MLGIHFNIQTNITYNNQKNPNTSNNTIIEEVPTQFTDSSTMNMGKLLIKRKQTVQDNKQVEHHNKEQLQQIERLESLRHTALACNPPTKDSFPSRHPYHARSPASNGPHYN